MNRPIKYRAWDKEENRYWYSDQQGSELGEALTRWLTNSDRYIVEQFTGLKDKLGKEIYEGDIVKDCSHSDLVFAVEWNDKWGGYKLPDSFDEEYSFPLSEIECEVIGNIYEKPELLTSSQQ